MSISWGYSRKIEVNIYSFHLFLQFEFMFIPCICFLVQVVNVKDGYTITKTGFRNGNVQIFGVIAFVIVALFCSVLYQKRDNWKKGEYQPLLNDELNESRI